MCREHACLESKAERRPKPAQCGQAVQGAAQVNTACRMPPALPPDPLDVLGEEASSQYPNWAPLGNSGSTVWAFEGFITVRFKVPF